MSHIKKGFFMRVFDLKKQHQSLKKVILLGLGFGLPFEVHQKSSKENF